MPQKKKSKFRCSVECKNKTKQEVSRNITSGKISLGRIYGSENLRTRKTGSCGVDSGCLSKNYFVKQQVIPLCGVICSLGHSVQQETQFPVCFFFYPQTITFYLNGAIGLNENIIYIIDLQLVFKSIICPAIDLGKSLIACCLLQSDRLLALESVSDLRA